MLRKIIKTSAFVLLGSFLLLLSLLLALWLNPQILLNQERIRWAIDRYSSNPESIYWDDLRIQIKRKGFWNRSVVLQADGLCYQDTRIQTCLTAEIKLSLLLRPFLEIPIHKIEITQSFFKLLQTEESLTEHSERKDSSGIDIEEIESWIQRTRISQIESFDITVNQIHISDQLELRDLSLQGKYQDRRIRIQSSMQIHHPFANWFVLDRCEFIGQGDLRSFDVDWSCDLQLSSRAQHTQSKDEPRLSLSGSVQLSDSIRREGDLLSSKVSVELESFQNLLLWLEPQDLSLPAPLHVLDGTVDLQFAGRVPMNFEKFSEIQLNIKTDLFSKEQKLKLEASGPLSFERTEGRQKLGIDLDILFRELILEAPPIGIAGLPDLLPDSRFFNSELEPDETAPTELGGIEPLGIDIEYSLRMRTEQPALLLSRLTASPVRLDFDIQLNSNQRPLGEIKLHRTQIEILRRRVELMGFLLEFKDEAPFHPIEGQLRVNQSEYRVSVDIDGNLDSPRIRLSSEPPLSEDEIYSVLLFGGTTDNLNSDELSSVASFKGAAVARAITLASLYFFVSTPIQSVSYNPETGHLQARVRLPQGVALQLGVDERGSRQVGLRRRLGYGFYIETELKSPRTESQSSEVSAFLQWFKRH